MTPADRACCAARHPVLAFQPRGATESLLNPDAFGSLVADRTCCRGGALEKREEIAIDHIRMRVHQPVREARVVDLGDIRDEPGGLAGRDVDWHDLIVLAVE